MENIQGKSDEFPPQQKGTPSPTNKTTQKAFKKALPESTVRGQKFLKNLRKVNQSEESGSQSEESGSDEKGKASTVEEKEDNHTPPPIRNLEENISTPTGGGGIQNPRDSLHREKTSSFVPTSSQSYLEEDYSDNSFSGSDTSTDSTIVTPEKAREIQLLLSGSIKDEKKQQTGHKTTTRMGGAQLEARKKELEAKLLAQREKNGPNPTQVSQEETISTQSIIPDLGTSKPPSKATNSRSKPPTAEEIFVKFSSEPPVTNEEEETEEPSLTLSDFDIQEEDLNDLSKQLNRSRPLPTPPKASSTNQTSEQFPPPEVPERSALLEAESSKKKESPPQNNRVVNIALDILLSLGALYVLYQSYQFWKRNGVPTQGLPPSS